MLIRLDGIANIKPGQLYMGEMCCQIIEDAEFIGIAIVKNPILKKYTVLFPSRNGI